MKKLQHIFVTLCLILFAAHTASAQNNVFWGPTYKSSPGLYALFYLAGGNSDNYFMVSRPVNKNELLKFDFNHKLISTSPIDFRFNGAELMFEEFITTKSKKFGMFSNYDKKAKTFSIQAAELVGGNFEPIKEVAVQHYIGQYKYIEDVGLNILGNTDDDATGSFAISLDKNYVAKIRILSNKESGQADLISVIVFDENLKVKWQKLQDFPYNDKKLDIQNFVVNNFGEVFLAITLDLPKMEVEKGLPYYNYQVVKITDSDFKEYKLNLSGNNVVSTACLFSSPENNDIYIGGFCKDKEKQTSGDNCLFFSKLDNATGSLNSKVYPFSKEFLDGMVKNKKIEDGDGIVNFKIKDFITFSDNTFSFIAEKSYITYSINALNGSSKTIYNTDEIIIPRFESNGELRNLVKLDKYYSSIDILRTSYFMGVKNNKLFLLFNDFKSQDEVIEANKVVYLKASNNTCTSLAIIDAKGQLESKKTLFTGKETNGFFFPSNSMQFEDKLLINTSYMMKYRFGTLKLE